MDIEQGPEEQGNIDTEEMTRLRVALACVGITVLGALLLGLVIVIGDMFNKKIWR